MSRLCIALAVGALPRAHFSVVDRLRIGPRSYSRRAAPRLAFLLSPETRSRIIEQNRPVGHRRRCDAGERGCGQRR
jgi:hypothetical protein